MRITNRMLSQNLLRNLETAQGRMGELQNQMSSGKRISRPSDDPVGIENALRIKSGINAFKQWGNNANEALAYMESTDSILGNLTGILQRVRELAVQGASDSLTSDDKKKVALEVEQLTEQIRITANTKIGTKYIFGGTKTDIEPMDSTGNWHGNNIEVSFEVGNNVTMPISVRGTDVFQVDSSTGKVGMFESLRNLMDGLNGIDNGTGIPSVGDAIGEIESQIDNVLAQRANVGARVNRMGALRDQLEITEMNLKQNLSEIQDADMAEAIIEFKNQENVYRAALSVGAQIIQPSLVDFMK